QAVSEPPPCRPRRRAALSRLRSGSGTGAAPAPRHTAAAPSCRRPAAARRWTEERMPLLAAEREADDEGLLQTGVPEPRWQQAAPQPRRWPRLSCAALWGAAVLLAAGCASAGALRRGRPPRTQALDPLRLEEGGDDAVQLRSANGSAVATHGGAAGLQRTPEERLDAMRLARKELVQAGVPQSVVIAPLDESIAQLRASIEELQGAAPLPSPGGGRASAAAKPQGQRSGDSRGASAPLRPGAGQPAGQARPGNRSGGGRSEPRREEDARSSAAGIWDAAVLRNSSDGGRPHGSSGAPAGKEAPGGGGSDKAEGHAPDNSSVAKARGSGPPAGKEAPDGSGTHQVGAAVLGNSSRGGRDAHTPVGHEAAGGNGTDQVDCSSCGWYRVLTDTVAREGRSLQSPLVEVIAAHTLIRVTRREGRRVQIDVPIMAWMSLRTEEGLQILRREDSASDAEKQAARPVRLPNGTIDLGNITKSLERLRREGMKEVGQKLTDKGLQGAAVGEKKLVHAVYGIDEGRLARAGERFQSAERSAESSLKDAASTAEQALSTPDPLKLVRSTELALAVAARKEAEKALHIPEAELPGNLTARLPGNLTSADAEAQLPKGLKVPTAAQVHEALGTGGDSLRDEVKKLFR
ncbi:unnamed protein product, partial [Prorocentrum cordatum]